MFSSLAEMPLKKARHSTVNRLTLPLLVTLIGTDHVHHPAAADDLAVLADLFDGRSDFHARTL